MLKKLVKSTLPKSVISKLLDIKNNYFDVDALKSYSQEGEDMILRRLFEKQQTGFYVDVGAHHPKRFSNTYLFYKRGWRGINIDLNPLTIELFNFCRREDININSAISDVEEIKKLYFIDELNTQNTLESNHLLFLKDHHNLKEKEISLQEIKTKKLLSQPDQPEQEKLCLLLNLVFGIFYSVNAIN